MKRVVLAAAVVVGMAAGANAQSLEHPYVAPVIGASVGGTTSVLVGAEAGARIFNRTDGFVELGWIPDLPTGARDASAGIIAGGLAARTGQPASFDAKTSTFYGGIGARYRIFAQPLAFNPYVSGVLGFARSNQDVKFNVGGADVTSNLQGLGVTLGSDLKGASTKPTLGIGVGVIHPWRGWDLDIGYRYTRLFTDLKGTNAHRVHIAADYRF
jgi:opacity protein-like surface antigen